MSVAMLLAGIVESAVAEQRIIDRTLEVSMIAFQDETRGLERALAEATTAAQRSTEIESTLHHLAQGSGEMYVGLFGADGRVLAEPAGAVDMPREIEPARLAEVVTGRSATVHPETDSGERGQFDRYEFLLPIKSPDGLLILEVDKRAEFISGEIADLRLRKLLGLLLAIVIAVPLSYVLGGRALHRRQLRTEREADTDALTGLAGRRPFRPTLEAALAHTRESTIVLALVDLDGFKQINDRLGHSHGDRILIALAESFGGLRATDTAFRLGGDEFAVVLSDCDQGQARERLDRVRGILTRRFPGVTFSCGIASSTATEPVEMQELWERSDSALYEAKHRGRRQTVTFDSMTMRHTVSPEKLDAVSALLSPGSQLTAVFQPIWDLRRGVVLAHEALLRLPEGSPITGPQEAFELAQRLGVADALDARARSTVLAAVRARDWQGLLFLNVHPDSLATLDVDALIVDLADAGLEPADVVLEITEQAGLDHPEPIRTLKRAHKQGFRLALDDMGQSNAGLRALTLVRFDVVKLDGNVVARLGTHPSAAATVAAATTFVQQTGGWVIAEGIENLEMLAALLGPSLNRPGSEPVLAGQGYLLGRPHGAPLPFNERLPLLDEHRLHATSEPEATLGTTERAALP